MIPAEGRWLKPLSDKCCLDPMVRGDLDSHRKGLKSNCELRMETKGPEKSAGSSAYDMHHQVPTQHEDACH